MTTTKIELAATVAADLREIGESVADITSRCNRGMETTVSTTPNGREIRVAKDGQAFVVQPHNDNYWIRVETIDAAMDAFANPENYR